VIRIVQQAVCALAALIGVAVGMGCCADCYCPAASIEQSVTATDHAGLEDATVHVEGGNVEIRYHKSDGTHWKVTYASSGFEAFDSGETAAPAETGDSAAP
jgi:hypothetical protein